MVKNTPSQYKSSLIRFLRLRPASRVSLTGVLLAKKNDGAGLASPEGRLDAIFQNVV